MLKTVPTIPAGQTHLPPQAPLLPLYMIPCNLCGAPMERTPLRVCSACITASLNPSAV